MGFRHLSWIVAIVVLAFAPPATLRAAVPMAVDLALVLAVDASMSVDESEAGAQRSGYIKALRDPRVGRAIRGGPIGRIAVTYMEWSSPYHQTVIIPWRILKDEADAKKMADELYALK